MEYLTTFSLHSLLMTAMDLTEPTIEASLLELKPDFVFHDFTHWLPALARRLGIKSVHHCTVSPAFLGYLLRPERKLNEKTLTPADFMAPPPSFPPSMIKLRAHETRHLTSNMLKEYGRGISFMERQIISVTDSDALSFKACREIDGPYCDYVEEQFRMHVILAGPVVPAPPTSALDEKWEKWLDSFKEKTMIFCAFGSECILKKDHYNWLWVLS
jgi:hypothetical protein